MVKRIKKIDYIMLLSVLLIISVILNIYAVFKVNSYKYKMEQLSYTKIEDFKQKNESNMDILSKSIEEKGIKNQDLLKLYKNYDVMCSDVIELWQQYASYTQSAVPFFTKNIKTNKVIENDIQVKIKEYTLSRLNKEMKNDNSKLILEGDDLNSFKAMLEISSRLYDYFNKFNEDNLKDLTGENREKEVIKQRYWIDMLGGIYNISDDYVNLQWKIEDADED